MVLLRALATVNILAVLSAPAQWKSVGTLDSVRQAGPNSILLYAGQTVTGITLLANDCVRVRFVPGGTTLPADFSWAVTRTSWPSVAVAITRTPDTLRMQTASLSVIVTGRPLRVTFADRSGRVILADHPAKGMAWSGSEVRVWKSMPAGERFFGFGEKAGRLDRRGTHMSMWNSDIPAYAADTDPLYQSIPFFYGFAGSRAYGLFFDNPRWSSFDMGKESPDQYSFGAQGGELDYYLFQGPSPKNILSRFTELVGRMPLPPLWSLGYQQCRWSYTPDTRVREIAARFRKERIPCDAIYLDIDYMEGYRVFTWNSRTFSSPQDLLRDLAKSGFKVVTIIDPGIKSDPAYGVYRSGLEGDHFVKRRDGSVFIGQVWPGLCAFPDFSRAPTRAWWGQQYAPLVDAGVKGWWNDMNEPSVFNVPTKTIDLDARHRPDGGDSSHAAVHNIYGMQMTRGTYEGVRSLSPEERPFVLTRASYAGGQRYAAAWTGDNVASWEHLEIALKMCLALSISGQPFVGSDIGGFIGTPSGELFARWLQLGAFSPLMRAHSAINEKNKEPWEYGARHTAINRETIRLRYRMLPYIYATMEQASRTGIPAMRPVIFETGDDGHGSWNESEFFFGSHLLVAPVLHEGERRRDVELPPGDWFDFWTSAPLKGGTTIHADAPLAKIPLYVRAGSIIPTQPPVQYTGESPVDPLTLLVYPAAPWSGPGETELYEDDGISFRYLDGQYLRRRASVENRGDSILVTLSAPQGSYRPARRSVVLRTPANDRIPSSVRVGNVTLPRSPRGKPLQKESWTINPADSALMVQTADRFEQMICVIRY